MTIKATITDAPSRAAITMAPIAPGPRDPAVEERRRRTDEYLGMAYTENNTAVK